MSCGHQLDGRTEGAAIDYTLPKSYTPKFLADKILNTRSAIEGERKLVTVLFADVANYMAMSEKLDPEEVHHIMDGAFRLMMDAIHQHEGTINQFTGDGIMALFGAPIAHEEHAQRACHAALALQKSIKDFSEKIKREYGFGFTLRIGLNSGPVVVGSIGDDLRMDYTAIGETTNLAARMEEYAQPGTVVLSKGTRRLIKDYFELKSLGKIEMKGTSSPQEVYELLRPSDVGSRFAASVAKGLTRFVGRRNSMAGLMESYAKVRSGEGQVVGIVGDAGVGKSRLLLEFINLLPQNEYTYLAGHCLNYGSTFAYLPVLDMLKEYFGIKSCDREYVIKKKMGDKLLRLNRELQKDIPPFQAILSLKVDDQRFNQLEPQQKREKTFEAIRNLFVRLSQEKPLVLAMEDLHWIDKTSEDFTNYLIRWLGKTRIMLILLYRPEYTHQWGSKSYYTKIGLNQLGISSSTELVRAVLEDGEVAPEIGKLVLDRTSGNPLFIEEFTHSLLESGSIHKHKKKYILKRDARDIEVPDTIQGLIAARIDRLDENIKRTMQVASVIGRDFAYRILQTITGMREELKAYLLNLQGLEFIYEKRLFPELEYIFKHALTQEVAYYSLLNTRRKDLHRRVGQAMEQVFADRITEYSSIIAEHFLRGEDWEHAFFYLDKAGDSAAGLFSYDEARLHYARALNTLDELEDSEDNRRRQVDTIIKLTLTSWRAISAEQSLKRLSTAEKLARDLPGPDGKPGGDSLRLARVRFWKGRVYYSSGQMHEALSYYDQVLPVAKATGDAELLAIPSGAIGQAMAVLGHLGKSQILLGEAIPLFEQMANWTEWIQAKSFYGSALAGSGAYQQGVAEIKLARDRAKECQFITGLGVSNNCLGFTHLFGGRLEEAMKAGQAAVSAAKQSGDLIYQYVGYVICGWAGGRAGEIENATKHLKQAQTVAQQLGGQIIMADLLTTARAETALMAGQQEEAIRLARQAVDIAQKMGGVLGEGVARRIWGQALAAKSDPAWDDAEEQMAKSLEVLSSGQNLPEMARTQVVWGTISRNRGKPENARHYWEQAATFFETATCSSELENVRRLLETIQS